MTLIPPIRQREFFASSLLFTLSRKCSVRHQDNTLDTVFGNANKFYSFREASYKRCYGRKKYAAYLRKNI